MHRIMKNKNGMWGETMWLVMLIIFIIIGLIAIGFVLRRLFG